MPTLSLFPLLLFLSVGSTLPRVISRHVPSQPVMRIEHKVGTEFAYVLTLLLQLTGLHDPQRLLIRFLFIFADDFWCDTRVNWVLSYLLLSLIHF